MQFSCNDRIILMGDLANPFSLTLPLFSRGYILCRFSGTWVGGMTYFNSFWTDGHSIK